MRFRSSLVCLAALLAACGGSSPADGGPPDAGRDLTPVWLVQNTIASPAGRTSYVQTIPAIVDGDRLTTESAVELPSFGRMFFDAEAGLFLGAGDGESLTEYIVGDDGRLVPGETISFASFGFGVVPFPHVFAAADRAFLFSGQQRVGAIWNPQTLTLEGEVDLSSLVREGLNFEVDAGVARDGKIFLPLQYVDFISLAVFEGVAIAVIDVETGVVESVTTDERCVGGFTRPVLADDGTIYVLGDGYGGLLNIFGEDAPDTCLLRIPPGQETFDSDYMVALPPLLGGRQGISFNYAGDDVAFVVALYEDRLSEAGRRSTLAAIEDPAARWWRVDLSAMEGTELTDLGFLALRAGNSQVVGDRVFLTVAEGALTGSSTTSEVDRDTGATIRTFAHDGVLNQLHPIP